MAGCYTGGMNPRDIEDLERATLAAVPPQHLEERDGWLLAFDDGTVGRAHSAVPLSHGGCTPGVLRGLVERYRERGHAPVLRIPRLPAFQPLAAVLTAAGMAPSRPTLVLWGPAAPVAALGPASGVRLSQAPGPGWADVFLGEGFDPRDGASRLAILGRSRDSVFAQVQDEGRVAAVGSACFGHGWCGVHGMRTSPAARRRGYASAILAALAHEARQRGIERVFLQVQEENAGARALYARAGLAPGWLYEYWA
jgi:GNAT superfamily N-acetyltransferase